MVRVSLFLVIILLALHSFAVEVGPERELSTRAIEPLPFSNAHARVATNGTDFLVVWLHGSYGRGQLRFARVDRNGALLDEQSLGIEGATEWFAVASDGENYVVAFQCDGGICVRRIDASTGVVLGGATIGGTTIAGAGRPEIASNGNGYVVAYVDYGRSSINAVELRPDATPAGEPVFVGGSSAFFAMASNGRDYYIACRRGSTLRGTLFSEGVVRDTRHLMTQTSPVGPPAIASDGNRFAVLSQNIVGAVADRRITDLSAVIVSADGDTISEPRVVFSGDPSSPSLTWTGTRYSVLFTAQYAGDVFAMGMTNSGEPLGAPALVSGQPRVETSASIASNGTNVLAIWESQVLSGVIEGRLLGQPPFAISRGVAWQDQVSAAEVDGQTVVVWSEYAGDEGKRRVMMQRLDDAGPLDGRGVVVAESHRSQFRPVIAGSLIAWIEEENEYGDAGRVSVVRAKAIHGDRVIEVGPAQFYSRVAIAAVGTTHLVAWASPDGEIKTTRVSRESVLDPVPLTIGPGVDPAVATDGHRFLVAWNRIRPVPCVEGCIPPRSIHAAAISRTGNLASAVLDLGPEDSSAPVVVWNGSDYVVFWFDSEWYGPPRRRMLSRRVSRAGVPEGMATPIAEPATPLSARWSGEDYLLVVAGDEFSLVRVDEDFKLVDSTEVRGPHWMSTVVLTGQWLVYNRFRLEIGSISRVIGRRIGEDVAVPRRRRIGR